jgi:hypothetical protein
MENAVSVATAPYFRDSWRVDQLGSANPKSQSCTHVHRHT